PGEVLVEAAVGGEPGRGVLDEGHNGGPWVVDSQRVHGIGGDLLGGIGEDLGRDDLLVREVPVGGAGSDAGFAGDVVERRIDAAFGEHRAGSTDQPVTIARRVL